VRLGTTRITWLFWTEEQKKKRNCHETANLYGLLLRSTITRLSEGTGLFCIGGGNENLNWHILVGFKRRSTKLTSSLINGSCVYLEHEVRPGAEVGVGRGGAASTGRLDEETRRTAARTPQQSQSSQCVAALQRANITEQLTVRILIK